jgi:hypothetical protein
MNIFGIHGKKMLSARLKPSHQIQFLLNWGEELTISYQLLNIQIIKWVQIVFAKECKVGCWFLSFNICAANTGGGALVNSIYKPAPAMNAFSAIKAG